MPAAHLQHIMLLLGDSESPNTSAGLAHQHGLRAFPAPCCLSLLWHACACSCQLTMVLCTWTCRFLADNPNTEWIQKAEGHKGVKASQF